MAMQFVVPQFIDVESKVFGPISVRQFIILLITGGIIWIYWELFTFWVAVILGVLTFAIGGTIAFVKINGQNFHIFALVLVQTFKNPNLKIWEREAKSLASVKEVSAKKKKNKNKEVFMAKPKLSKSQITEASLMVDTDGVYKTEELAKKIKEEKNQK